jgi:hypothetical protein
MRFELIKELLAAAMDYCQRDPELVMWRCFWGVLGAVIGLQLAFAVSAALR